jgi:hypothetical protein
VTVISAPKRKGRKAKTRSQYEQRKARSNARERRLSASVRDIGKLPPCQDPARREACRLDLRLFCEMYHQATFHLAWSDDHLQVITALQSAVLEGGQAAIAMPRGSGKTALSIAACEWALLYAHRRFLLLIAATEAAGEELLKLIRGDLESAASPIAADFPEVSFPLAALEGIANRAAGQMHRGKRTRITLTADEIVLPTIEGNEASGAILRVAGLLGRIRGHIARLPGGGTARPDMVIIDDPQTDESAQSLTECAKRERVLAGNVIGLGAAGKRIAVVATVTVIREGDVADRLLNRQIHPEWNGRRMRLLYVEPTNAKLWEQYDDARRSSLELHGDIRGATEFYLEHRADLDAGAVIAWPARFLPGEASALQHAMNLRLQDAAAFAAEYQNEPLTDRARDAEAAILSADMIMRRLSGFEVGVIPLSTVKLTASIDVQQRALYYLVAAWREDFTGCVVDYGIFPRQATEHVLYKNVRPTLQDLAPLAGVEGAILAGLEQLTESLMARTWQEDGGQSAKITRCLIDANWRESTEVVYTLCRRSPHAMQLMPSHGRFVGLSAKPLSEWAKKPGDRAGLGWRVPVDSRPRHVVFDTGLWKSHVHARLSTAPGNPGNLTLFGKQQSKHRMLAEHLTSETRERMRGSARSVDIWTLLPHRDNHLLDCLVGAAVAASIEGCALPGMAPVRRRTLAARPPRHPRGPEFPRLAQ